MSEQQEGLCPLCALSLLSQLIPASTPGLPWPSQTANCLPMWLPDDSIPSVTMWTIHSELWDPHPSLSSQRLGITFLTLYHLPLAQ